MIQNSHHVWLDHLNIWDGRDGNIDIVTGSGYVTVSWCKLWYTDFQNDHRYSCLVGNGAEHGDTDRTDTDRNTGGTTSRDTDRTDCRDTDESYIKGAQQPFVDNPRQNWKKSQKNMWFCVDSCCFAKNEENRRNQSLKKANKTL